jgi:hypothetical protein
MTPIADTEDPMEQEARNEEALVQRRHVLRALGLVGAATAGFTALDPSSGVAFELTELETKLHELGASAVKSNIAIGSALAHKAEG